MTLRALVAPIFVGILAPTLAGCVFGLQAPKDTLFAPGAKVFNQYKNPEVDCYKCHNGDGTGSFRGPNLAVRVPMITDEHILSVIQDGKGRMPAYKGKITETETNEILAWLRSSFQAATPP